MGSRSCGEWVANKDLNRDRGLASANDFTWLAGFLSGYSYGEGLDVLKNTSGNSLSLWIYNFCKAHPLEDASVAAGVLFLTLKQQKGYK